VSQTDQKKLRAAVNKLGKRKTITLDDVLSFAKSALIAGGKDTKAHEQCDIEIIREEIARLQPLDLSSNHIPNALDELDIAVTANEEAAERILTCAEKVMSIEASDAEAYKASVNEAMLEILEACAFQDISGQHTSKAVDTLNRVDRRISRFAKASGMRDWVGAASDCEARKSKRQKELILHGPAKDGDGLAQDDIDALLAG
jgi:chemotaxis protein CheZ